MHNYYIVHKIPKIIEKQLITLCFGPPQISWIDENHLYFFIRTLGALSDFELNEVKRQMQTVFFQPFTLVISKLSQKQVKNKGVIGIECETTPDLLNLNKEMDKSLRPLNLKKIPDLPFPIILGYYENLNFERLSDYMTYSSFTSHTLQISELLLLHTWPSSKRTVYEEIERFPAAQMGLLD